MKKLIPILLILTLLTGCEQIKTPVSNNENPYFSEENLTKNTNTPKLKDEFKGETRMVNGEQKWTDTYDMDNLENDIAQMPDEEMDIGNYIKYYSKEESFEKENLISLYTALKNGELETATNLLVDNNYEISPFHPTCCYDKEYLTAKPYKNGVLGLLAVSQDGSGYEFYYLTVEDNMFYEFAFSSSFESVWTENDMKLMDDSSYTTLIEGSREEMHQYMIDLFNEDVSNATYSQELENTMEEINNFYK